MVVVVCEIISSPNEMFYAMNTYCVILFKELTLRMFSTATENNLLFEY